MRSASNVNVSQKIIFNNYGWQLVYTTSSAIILDKGCNELKFICGRGDLPQIKELSIYNETRDLNTIQRLSAAYDNISGIATISQIQQNEVQQMANNVTTSIRPGYNLSQPYYYTFSITHSFPDDSYNFPSTSPKFSLYSSESVGLVGSSKAYTAYVFAEDPSVYSSSATSNSNGYLYFEGVIPGSSLFYILIEAEEEGAIGGVNLVVNNQYTYRMAVFTKTTFDINLVSETNSDMTIPKEYNIFTANLKSANEYYDADPILWLKEEVDGKMVIVDYSDNHTPMSIDYSETDSVVLAADIARFNEDSILWGANSRIIREMSSENTYNVLLSSAIADVYNCDTCDIYHSNRNTFETLTQYRFEDRERDDLIESGAFINAANCYSFTVGYYENYFNDPTGGEAALEWFDDLYSNQTVSTHFGYYKRDDDAIKYTRIDSNDSISIADDAVIDIYAHKSSTGSWSSVSHASIRHSSDGIAHGYDWESKMGIGGKQIYHPRYRIGEIYGDTVAHYKIDPRVEEPTFGLMTASSSPYQILCEISVTAEEEGILSGIINNQSLNNTNNFDALYAEWAEPGINKLVELYNTGSHKNSAYQSLIQQLNNMPNGYVMLFDEYLDGDDIAALIIKDIFENPQSEYYTLWQDVVFAPIENNIVRSSRYNVTKFIKEVLQSISDAAELVESEVGVLSASEITIGTTATTIEVVCNAKTASDYSVSIISIVDSRLVAQLPTQSVAEGIYNHSFSVSSGIYIVTYIVDGVTYSKKIIIS